MRKLINVICLLMIISTSLLAEKIDFSPVFAYTCEVQEQRNYSFSFRDKLYLNLSVFKDKKSSIVTDGAFQLSLSETKIKNVYINKSLFAFDILQLDKNEVIINHYSQNGIAYTKWLCKQR